MASDINNHEENEINVNESFINSSNNLNEYLIKKCSMFDTKQKCKILFDNVVQSVEGTFSEYYEQEIKNQLNMEHEFERQLSSQKNKVDRKLNFKFFILFIKIYLSNSFSSS